MVSVGGAWMLTVAAFMLYYYLSHMSVPPPLTPGTTQDYKALLELHKAASDQFRESLSFVFDLMVTKTILPLVTLLLGYLFGSKKS